MAELMTLLALVGIVGALAAIAGRQQLQQQQRRRRKDEALRQRYQQERREKEVASWGLKRAKAEMSTEVYSSACLMEELERAGHTLGNGHTAAQKIAEFAANKVEQRWRLQRVV